ncbi:MAG: DUF4293 domain-containing protein [Paludibacter sp.]|nr:DUF4293 domain-containing protein [Bacteroidales bacterium]MCM1069117.1 DUF4293 domain-containing protein [Prevotella sp.]MCM1353556.1 DUF4293 domain-containing protein [Bacteroides sp.]MCM1442717.1 DUF4293 domain-containing protein [Muribaculum sp.]MCM1481647.1 DUF4293 domain-containing protein [Paludibacter sp.]
MIQRLQTLWLFLVVVVGTVLCFLSPMQFLTYQEVDTQHTYELLFASMCDTTNPANTWQVMSVWPLAVLEVIIPLLALAIIFLYKRRILQVRLCVVNLVLMFGYYIVLAIYTWAACANFNVDWYVNLPAALPLVNMVFTFMAMRLILKDEALVRAANRLR